MDSASKNLLLELLDYEQQTVQNNNTPSRKYRNKIQHYANGDPLEQKRILETHNINSTSNVLKSPEMPQTEGENMRDKDFA